MFDGLDFVFFAGDGFLLPWKKKMRKVVYFER